MKNKKGITETPLTVAQEKTLELYNEALTLCGEEGVANFDFSTLDHQILLKAKKISFKVFNDVGSNKIRKML